MDENFKKQVYFLLFMLVLLAPAQAKEPYPLPELTQTSRKGGLTQSH